MNKLKEIGIGAIRLIKYNFKVFILLCIVVPILYGIIFGSHGVIQRVSYYYENKELQSDLDKELKTQMELKTRINSLKTDKSVIEKLAKERYGMVRPGETLYKIQIVEE